MEYTLKTAREAARKTQQEMAENLGISLSAYQKLERYPENVTIQQAKLLCSVLGVSVDELSFLPENLLKVE